MVIVLGNGHGDTSSNPGRDCISSALVRQLVLEKEISEFKPIKLRLNVDLVSYPDRAEELVNMNIKEKYCFE